MCVYCWLQQHSLQVSRLVGNGRIFGHTTEALCFKAFLYIMQRAAALFVTLQLAAKTL